MAEGRIANGKGARIKKVLVVDDDPTVVFGVSRYLEQQGYEVGEAGSCEEVRAALEESRPDAVLLDYVLPDGDALDLLPRLQDAHPDLVTIVLTGHGSIDLAVETMKLGAEHFLTKPVDLSVLERVLERSLSNQQMRRRSAATASRRGERCLDPFLGTSRAIRQLRRRSEKMLASDRPVLILGETGSGKGVLARWLHQQGPRSGEPWVELNCAGLPEQLLESELFGHEKGAFTGAVSRKEGLLEVAHGGTLFLDEIGDMPPSIQAKLLKVLEEQRIRRVGDVRERRVDLRLVAATHRDLLELSKSEAFRRDLFYRISTLPLEVAPLRKRREDIPHLARFLLESLSREMGHPALRLTDDALERLQAYPWPGNIRELRNVLERAALLSEGDCLGVRDLVFDQVMGAGKVACHGETAGGVGTTGPAGEAPANGGADPVELSLEELERLHIRRVLEAQGGSMAATARSLGIARSTLYEKIKRYGIEVS